MRINYHSTNTLNGTSIELPLSKSLSHRLFMLNALHDFPVVIPALSQSRDTTLFTQCLKSATDYFNFQDAGTPARFALAYFAAKNRSITLDGNESLRRRSIAPLVDALSMKGAKFEFLKEDGFFPVKIIQGVNKNHPLFEAPWTVDSNESSQYVSALMLISSLEGFPQEIKVNGLDHSWSYIQMTQQILRRWGIPCSLQEGHISIDNNNIKPPQTIEMEADWSSSAFFYLVSLISGQSLKFSGLKELSDQGDAIVTNLFEGLGVKTITSKNDTSLIKSGLTISNHAEFDASEYPDLIPVLISTLVYLKIEATIYGIENLKKKESNRIDSINQNIKQLSSQLIDNHDGSYQLKIDREPHISKKLHILTNSDHRIAMAFAPWACQIPSVYIDDWKCTEKSFPNFWNELQKCGYTLVKEI